MKSLVSAVRQSLVVALVAVTSAAGCARSEAPAARAFDVSPSSATTASPVPAIAATATATATAAATTMPGSSAPSDAPLPRAAAMITTVNMTIATRSVREATARLRDETGRVDGYVSNMSAAADANQEGSVSITIRVPSGRVGTFRSAIAGLGEVKSETERVDDVGGERADRRARLVNARAEEKRLLELLANRTGSLSEVLAAERELARVRETIERFDAQAADLEGRIALATVNVQLVPVVKAVEPAPPPSTTERIAKAGSNGIRYAGVVLVGTTIAIAEAGPTLLMMAVVMAAFALAVRAVVRRGRRLAVHVDRA